VIGLDAMLAATYLAAGVHVIATLDSRDFARFVGFAPIVV
jgi:predicted nucleic acid-binding protein